MGGKTAPQKPAQSIPVPLAVDGQGYQALQIAAMSPSYVHAGQIEDEVLEKEKRIAEEKAREEGKPEQVISRIVEGRIKDFYKDVCLHDQPSVSDDKLTVGAMLDKAGVVVTRFARFSAGA